MCRESLKWNGTEGLSPTFPTRAGGCDPQVRKRKLPPLQKGAWRIGI